MHFAPGKNVRKSNSLPIPVHQSLSSSLVLINMLINSMIDLIANANCQLQPEIKYRTANLLLARYHYCLVNHNLLLSCLSLKGKVAICEKIYILSPAY